MYVATHGHQKRALDLTVAGIKGCGEPPDMSAGNWTGVRRRIFVLKHESSPAAPESFN